jgi:TolB-like protein
LLAGCASQPAERGSLAHSTFIAANYRAADELLAQLQGRLPLGQPLIVATVVNIDALDQSSTLGRLVSEQISARFSRSGYNMIEMKFRNNVYMSRGEGELLLSREISEIARAHNARAAIVGTYGVSGGAVYLNVKVVDPGANFVMAAHDYALPLTSGIQTMLGGGSTGGSAYAERASMR